MLLNQIIDFLLFLVANLYNLLMVAIFLSRPTGLNAKVKTQVSKSKS